METTVTNQSKPYEPLTADNSALPWHWAFKMAPGREPEALVFTRRTSQEW